jgi:hypothetical protein
MDSSKAYKYLDSYSEGSMDSSMAYKYLDSYSEGSIHTGSSKVCKVLGA